jgi:hypothetical protein
MPFVNFSGISAVMSEGRAEDFPAVARVADQVLLAGLMLFAIAIPHSIAGANIGLGLCLPAWLVRDLTARRFHFRRTPADWPLLCFALLTAVSAVFSEEPSLSLPKLKGLIIFGVIYLVASSLNARGVNFLVTLLLISALAGVSYSLLEKATGRGLIVTAIEAESPLAGSELQTGDVICFIGRDRVRSLADTARFVSRQPVGRKIEIEALHEGDPVQIDLIVTEQMKASPNPLGVSVDGRTRRFRVSGFSRHFITYADQMQLFALLCYGWTIVLLKKGAARKPELLTAGGLFALFALALLLTSSRAAMAAFLVALVAMSVLAGGKRIAVAAVVISVVLGSMAYFTLISTRAATTGRFIDDSTARRLGYMRAGLRLIPQHPLLGVGMDAHKLHWREWGFPGDYITHTHSTPIQLALDRGLPALACYFWLMAVMVVTAWRGYKMLAAREDLRGSALALGATGALIGFAAGSLVNYNFGDSEVVMLLLLVWTLAFIAGDKDGLCSS